MSNAMLEEAERAQWTQDEYGTYWLKMRGPHGEAAVFLMQRNSYCDRGHWHACVDHGIPSLDHADSFPRYFMRLEVAKQEMRDWLLWRLFKRRAERYMPVNLAGAVMSAMVENGGGLA